MSEPAATLRLRDAYATLYSVTLLAFVPAVLLLGTRAMYSYDGPYLALMVAPPLIGMVALVFGHDRASTPLRTAGKALLYGVSAMVLGAALFLSASFLLALLGPAFESHAFGPLQVGVGLIGALFVLPLALSALSRVRSGRPVAIVEAMLVLAGAAVLVWVGYEVLLGDGSLVDMLRKDQVSYLVGGVFWYIPAYAFVGSMVRATGIL